MKTMTALLRDMAPLKDRMSRRPEAQAPRYRWLTWGPVAIALLWTVGEIGWVRVPFLHLFIVFVVLMLLNAVRFFPRGDGGADARRRLPLLAVLVLPWIASILFGPLGLVAQADAGRNGLMIVLQNVFLATAVILPLVLLPAMGGGRRFTLAVGVLNLLATFLITTASIMALAGGESGSGDRLVEAVP